MDLIKAVSWSAVYCMVWLSSSFGLVKKCYNFHLVGFFIQIYEHCGFLYHSWPESLLQDTDDKMYTKQISPFSALSLSSGNCQMLNKFAKKVINILKCSNTKSFSNCLQIIILVLSVKSLPSNKQKPFYRMKTV